jgi:hypothetical protein
VAEMRAFESDACYETESEPKKGNDRGKKIINAEPNATISTTKSKRKNHKIQRRRSVSSTPKCG